MAGRARKYDATLKVYSIDGSKLETQGTRAMALKAVYLMMSFVERAQARDILAQIDAKDKPNG